jgi:hypothetical protein
VNWTIPARWVAGFFFLGGVGPGFGQSALPAISPTTAGSTATAGATVPPATSQPGSAAAPVTPTHRATVVYAKGQLEVSADNSSLNQILHEISRQTGMKITGGVADEKVYGKYGPAASSDVLADLLGGMGCNMLLRENAAKDPTELILTPRGGGPTPPNPNAAGFDTEPEQVPAVSAAAQTPNPHPPPPNVPGVGGLGGAEANQTPGTAKTPQQIYEQLQQMHQTQGLPKPQ